MQERIQGKSTVQRKSKFIKKEFKTSWPTWRNPVSAKNTKISRARWLLPVVPATPEAEAGESVEPGRRRLQFPLSAKPGPESIMAAMGVSSTPASKDGCTHFRRLRWPDSSSPGVRDQPGQHGKTPSLQKIQKSLTLSPRLECSGMISGQCNLHLLRSSDFPASASQRQGFTMLAKLVSISLPQMIHLPQPPKVLGLQA
ncbi:Protein fantom [Plecturocebus cupreus]